MLTVTKERPRLISELSPDIAKLIEDVTADSKGRLIPRLYSKLQASKELRAMRSQRLCLRPHRAVFSDGIRWFVEPRPVKVLCLR